MTDNQGGTGGTGGGTGGTGGGTGGGTPPAFNPAQADWSLAGLDADGVNHIAAKGFKSVAELVKGHKNAESLIGIPAEHVLRLPKGDSDADWAPIWDRLGRPKDVGDYKLPVPEGDDGAFAKTAAAWMHEAGVPVKMAQKIAAKWNEHLAGTLKTRDDEAKVKFSAEEAALKGEWRGDFDAHVAVAKGAVKAFGVKDEELAAIEQTLGFTRTMKLFRDIGGKIGTDDTFVAGGRPNFGGKVSPDQALAKIKELRGDSEFVKRYTSGDVSARGEMDALHRVAYPE